MQVLNHKKSIECYKESLKYFARSILVSEHETYTKMTRGGSDFSSIRIAKGPYKKGMFEDSNGDFSARKVN